MATWCHVGLSARKKRWSVSLRKNKCSTNLGVFSFLKPFQIVCEVEKPETYNYSDPAAQAHVDGVRVSNVFLQREGKTIIDGYEHVISPTQVNLHALEFSKIQTTGKDVTSLSAR